MNLIHHPTQPDRYSKYAERQFKRFLSNEFKFKKIKDITDEHITTYDKIFIDGNDVQPVIPVDMHIQKYKEHIMTYKHIYVDQDNKTMLISDRPLIKMK